MNTTPSTNATSTDAGCVNSTALWNSTSLPCRPQADDGTGSTLQSVFSIVVSVAVTIIMVGIGCSVEIKKVSQHFKNPTGILTGLFCQYAIMPLLAYAWARIVVMDSPETLALLIVGSCPGGTLSNVVAYWVGGDMELSATMTTASVTASLGMLPLLLFIYSKLFADNAIAVPFDTIGITLVLTIAPLAIGSLLRLKFPKVAAKVLKVCSVFGIVALFVLMGMSIYIFHPYWSFHPGLVIVAIVYPPCGMMLGFGVSSIVSIIAKPLRLTHRQKRTVSVETGIQNQQVARAVIQLSGFPLDVTGRMSMLPLMYVISQLIWSMAYIGLFHLVSFIRRGKCPHLKKNEEDEEKQTPVEMSTAAENPAFDEKE